MKTLRILVFVVLAFVVALVAQPLHPAHAAISGSLTSLRFPGATPTNCGSAQAFGGSVTTTTLVSDVGTLFDGNGAVVGSFSGTWNGTFTITNILFAIQPKKNPIRMIEVLGGVTVVDVSGDNPCLPSSGLGTPPLFFDPGDSRVEGHPGDRIAVYCPDDKHIEVIGVGSDSKGVGKASFKVADVIAAGKPGLSAPLIGFNNSKAKLGTVSIQIMLNQSNTSVYIAWNGGIFNATGQGDFHKQFLTPIRFCPYSFR